MLTFTVIYILLCYPNLRPIMTTSCFFSALQVNCVINLLLYPKVPQAAVGFTYETSGSCCIPDRHLKINNSTRACQCLVRIARASSTRYRSEYCAQMPTLDIVMFDTELAEFLVRCAYVSPFSSAVKSAGIHAKVI